MESKHLLVGLLLLFASLSANAQLNSGPTKKVDNKLISVSETRDLYPRKGKFFVLWGYNRASYGNSNMHFSGNGYDFSIYNIRASDDPTDLSKTYYGPTTFTDPQFNCRIGYYLSDKNFIAFGYDHMKYTILKQTTHLTGTISTGVNNGTYNNVEVLVGENSSISNQEPSVVDNLPKGFVSEFEHCDGLNDFNIELGRLEQLWISRDHKHALSVSGSLGLGAVIPDTDADILGQPPKHDMDANKKAYHLAGYSVSATMGFQFDFFKRYFMLARVKTGYINLPDINTTALGGKASQHFTFVEPMLVFGYNFNVHLRKKAKI